jgi:multiple antibiotic resistance protein
VDRLPFVVTIFIMLIGPIKLIPAFAKISKDYDRDFKRQAAIRGALIATALGMFVALSGNGLVAKYELSLASLELAGGLLLLLSALRTIFPTAQPEMPVTANMTPMRFALSPLATPTMISPMGIVAILIFVMLEPGFPGITKAVIIVFLMVMAVNFLVMYFHDTLLKIPGLIPIIQLIGANLVVMQVALAIDTMIAALSSLGVVTA